MALCRLEEGACNKRARGRPRRVGRQTKGGTLATKHSGTQNAALEQRTETPDPQRARLSDFCSGTHALSRRHPVLQAEGLGALGALGAGVAKEVAEATATVTEVAEAALKAAATDLERRREMAMPA